MKCEKCGKEIDRIMVNRFNHDGSDSLYNYSFCEVEQNAVCIDTDRNWVGYELTEEERIETIQCPHCGEFPFKSKEIQEHEIIRLVMFKGGSEEE